MIEGKQLKPVKSAADELRSSAEEMEDAAAAAGVYSKEPLGVFVKAMSGTLVHMADTFESFYDEMGSRIEGVHKLGETEVEKLRLANEASKILLLKADKAQMLSAGVREEAILKTVENIGPEVIAKLRPWLVLRETAYQKKYAWKRLVAGCVVGTALFWGGDARRAWEDRPYVTALGRCLEAKLQMTSNGHRICDVTDLVPHSAP